MLRKIRSARVWEVESRKEEPMITLAIAFFVGGFIGFILGAILACGKLAEKSDPSRTWASSRAESHPRPLQAKT